MSESPTAPQNAPAPKGDPAPAPDPNSVTVENREELLRTLDSLDIKTPERVQGLVNAGQQVGQLTDLLSDARTEITRLQMVNNQLQSAPPVQNPHDNGFTEQPPVQPTPGSDFEARMWNVLNNFMGHYTQQQTQQAMKANAEYEALGHHSDFGVVKPVFDKHIGSPAIQRKLLSGETTLNMEYALVRGDFMKNLALKGRDAMRGATPGAPPHIEGPAQGTPSPASVPSDMLAERAKRLADLKANTDGSDDSIEALMKELLPDDDPHLSPKQVVPRMPGMPPFNR